MITMEKKHYLQRLKVDMKLRGLSVNTQESYHLSVEKFLEFAGRTVEELDEEDIRRYLIHLCYNKITVKGTAASRVFFHLVAKATIRGVIGLAYPPWDYLRPN